MATTKKRKIVRYFLLVFWVSVLGWQFLQMNATGFDESEVFSSNSQVTFNETDSLLSFLSNDSSKHSSILFFPGALVQPKVYAPLARNLAEKGYDVYIQKISFRVAFTDNMEQSELDRAYNFMNSSKISNWIVAGHSRGGRMASNFASKYPKALSGMILLATSHPKETNLTSLKFPILKISASEDGLASPSEIDLFSNNLPPHTNFVMIDGGNHSQFGHYGFQFGAGSASISREEQQIIILSEITDYLNSIK
ncbi:MAG: alpha/beta fold hydrolase [Balneola sp.]